MTLRGLWLRPWMLWLLALGGACAREQDPRAANQGGAKDPTAREYQAPTLRRVRLYLSDAFGGQRPVDAEVAETDASRQRGLMWREKLPEGQGMLFVFPRAQEHSFWMANTLIPLDLLFLDDDWKVVGVLEELPPQSRISRTVGKPSRYVIEVPGGWVARAGVQPGSRVRVEGL